MLTFEPSSTLQLLNEPSDAVKGKVLKRLEPILTDCWPVAAEYVQTVDQLAENPDFPERKLAALVASKIYYHLGDHRVALEFALKAGDLFNVWETDEYVETMISEALDKYIEERKEAADELAPDERLQDIVNRMFQRCIETGNYKDAVAMAMETSRIDQLQTCLDGDTEQVLDYALDLATTIVTENALRKKILIVLLKALQKLADEGSRERANRECWIYYLLEMTDDMANLLLKLIGTEEGNLRALHLAFELYKYGDARFLNDVLEKLKEARETAEKPAVEEMDKICSILSGVKPAELELAFMYTKNQTDLNMFKQLKQSQRSDMLNQAVLDSYSIATCGTTFNDFVTVNMKWLGKMGHFAKFSAVAGFGTTATGHFKTNVLDAYLTDSGPYAMGGAFFARGIINSRNRGEEQDALRKDLMTELGRTSSEIVQHGISLALGMVDFGTHNSEVIEKLSEILMSDNAISGFASALAIGLIAAGSGNEEIWGRLFDHACDTQHEHIVRGCALGLAMIQLGRQSKADEHIQQLLAQDAKPILRLGGCYAMGLAYAGQGNSDALKQLLNIAVTDVVDDVRMAAVMNIGFLLCHEPDRVASVVDLLARSFNMHTRYGACAAIGASCAGLGGDGQAARLLDVLRKDESAFVQQGAYIASGFLLSRSSNEKQRKAAAAVQKKMIEVATGKHIPRLSKQGAILGLGIKASGGQNLSVELVTDGIVQLKAVASMALFWTFSQWFPLLHFVSSCFRPDAVIGLDKDLKMPKIQFKTTTPVSEFAYVEKIKKKDIKMSGDLKKAVLSKSTKKTDKKADDEKEDAEKPVQSGNQSEDKKMDVDAKEEDEKEEVKTHELENPSRVTKAQRQTVASVLGDRYEPVFQGPLHGVVILRDKKPTEEKTYVDTKVANKGLQPPPDFKYRDPLLVGNHGG